MTGSLDLSEREVQVLQLMSEGHSNGSIGRQLFLAEDTIKTHARRLFRKLGVSDRAHAVAVGLRRGLLRDRRTGTGQPPPAGDRRRPIIFSAPEAYEQGCADERARIRWWLLAGINGPAEPNLSEELRKELLELVELTYDGLRWREAPPARPRF